MHFHLTLGQIYAIAVVAFAMLLGFIGLALEHDFSRHRKETMRKQQSVYEAQQQRKRKDGHDV